MNDKAFNKARVDIEKKLQLAQTYFEDGAAHSAARCLIDAQVKLSKLTQETNETAIQRDREMEALKSA